MLAGIYEDPAAIILGWTGNSVKFDSVINESSNAWCWGSPNVVHMFNTGNFLVKLVIKKKGFSGNVL